MSCNDYNSLHEIRQDGFVANLLSVGSENAHTAQELATWRNCKPRDVTKAVERERQHGAAICATCDPENPGYYLAKDTEDLCRYLQSLKRRRRNVAKTEAALVATYCRMTGQQQLDLGATGGDL